MNVQKEKWSFICREIENMRIALKAKITALNLA